MDLREQIGRDIDKRTTEQFQNFLKDSADLYRLADIDYRDYVAHVTYLLFHSMAFMFETVGLGTKDAHDAVEIAFKDIDKEVERVRSLQR